MRQSSVQANMNQQHMKNAGARRRKALWLSFIAVFMTWAVCTLVSQSIHLSDKSAQLLEKQKSEQANQQMLDQLKYEVSRLKDPEYIGQIARKKYDMYLPDETPIRVQQQNGGK
ncbi:septum formation initiator family protein [Paenibacillus sediminis]|uniref:Cell division protein DivIC n=1 Tax=Paenibacillus sediminis TaxID=664909 RepID=A0ABS4H7J3_9BACL|nr:septum formation initiator family protein [Paenibacillus sediminis]MBP1938451.1 cell division protein DivIC [Paenibacillus sediminis]